MTKTAAAPSTTVLVSDLNPGDVVKHRGTWRMVDATAPLPNGSTTIHLDGVRHAIEFLPGETRERRGADVTPTYYRTRAGDHRHESWSCANTRRSLYGEVRTCTAEEAADLAPCTFCATGDEAVLAAQVEADRVAAAAVKAASQCSNRGVTHPGRIQSECRDCGKRGTVNRSTGSLRAHKPAPPAPARPPTAPHKPRGAPPCPHRPPPPAPTPRPPAPASTPPSPSTGPSSWTTSPRS